jgi:hypothetical protein
MNKKQKLSIRRSTMAHIIRSARRSAATASCKSIRQWHLGIAAACKLVAYIARKDLGR